MTPRRFTVVESREAMLVTADNLDEVAAWCGGQLRYRYAGPSEDVGGVLYRSEGERGESAIAFEGDYLVTDGHRWWDVDTDEFERQSAGWEEET